MRLLRYNLVRVNPSTGASSPLLNGGNRVTVNGVGTAAYSHETYCVWVEPSSGDIIWCDYGGSDGSGTGAIRRLSAATSATSIVFNVTSPVALTPDATGANWLVSTASNGLSSYNVASNSVSSLSITSVVSSVMSIAVNPATGVVYVANTKTLYTLGAPAPPPTLPPPSSPPGFMLLTGLSSCGTSSQFDNSMPGANAVDNHLNTEWATASVGAGSWICITLPSGHAVAQLTFWQRQGTGSIFDLILDALATFSDGATQPFRFSPYSLTTARMPVTVSVTGTPTWVNVSVVSAQGTGTGYSQGNVGLAEVYAYGYPGYPPPSPSPPPRPFGATKPPG